VVWLARDDTKVRVVWLARDDTKVRVVWLARDDAKVRVENAKQSFSFLFLFFAH
jgi:uncharacterized protein YpmB